MRVELYFSHRKDEEGARSVSRSWIVVRGRAFHRRDHPNQRPALPRHSSGEKPVRRLCVIVGTQGHSNPLKWQSLLGIMTKKQFNTRRFTRVWAYLLFLGCFICCASIVPVYIYVWLSWKKAQWNFFVGRETFISGRGGGRGCYFNCLPPDFLSPLFFLFLWVYFVVWDRMLMFLLKFWLFLTFFVRFLVDDIIYGQKILNLFTESIFWLLLRFFNFLCSFFKIFKKC